MGDIIDRATFLDQVKVGDLVNPSPHPYGDEDAEPWLVTGRRTAAERPGLVVLVGMTETGEPRTYSGFGWLAVIVRERVSETAGGEAP